MIATKTPQPGVYKDVPMKEYRAWDAVAQSDLSRFVNPDKKFGNSVNLGTALHSLIEGGDEQFNREFYERPKINTAKGKAEAAELAAANPDRVGLLPKEIERVRFMYDAIQGDSHAMKILNGAVDQELSIVGRHEGHESLCKCRIDLVTPRALWDVKTTSVPDKQMFIDSICAYGYALQASWYQSLYAAMHDGEWRQYGWLCVSSRTYDVWWQMLTPTQSAFGRKHWGDLLTLYERLEVRHADK